MFMIEVIGLEEAMGALASIPELLLGGMMGLVEDGGYIIQNNWKDIAVVDTGRYKSSIGHWTDEMVSDNKDASSDDAVWEISDQGLAIELQVGTSVPYGEKVEELYGHAGTALDMSLDDIFARAITMCEMVTAF